MTQADVTALKVDDKVGYQSGPGQEVLIATVTQNGPRLDADNNVIKGMNYLLVVKLDDSVVTFSWEPISYPNGIPQLHTLEAVGQSPTW